MLNRRKVIFAFSWFFVVKVLLQSYDARSRYPGKHFTKTQHNINFWSIFQIGWGFLFRCLFCSIFGLCLCFAARMPTRHGPQRVQSSWRGWHHHVWKSDEWKWNTWWRNIWQGHNLEKTGDAQICCRFQQGINQKI